MKRIAELIDVMARLRDPEHGCPWDRAQTFASIAPYTIEEAYEVADAIARDDMHALVDELGDLLFQVVFHARMASERGSFGFDDVAAAIVAKMVRRHPHVFAGESFESVAEQSRAWETHKAREREARGEARRESLLDGIPAGLAALQRASKLQRRAARGGFDWRGAKDVVPKLSEEIDELGAAVAAEEPAERVAEELGDLLFSVVNLARHLGIDPDLALRRSNSKFERRFRCMESSAEREGRALERMSAEEQDALWTRAKREDPG